MIIQRNREGDVLTKGNFETSDVSLDQADLDKVLWMLLEGNYKFPIASTIRELCSNALDTQVQAGVDSLVSPIAVGLDIYKFWVKDQGEGIDDERMKIISKAGASTKEASANTLGCFGIGIYSPLSTTSQFTIESVKDKVKRTWIIQKNGTKKQVLKVSEAECDESNGTLVTVPIKPGDYSNWNNALVETLVYFKGVHTYNEGFNQRKIIEGENFLWSTLPLDGFHIVLDQVAYTINTVDLGLPNVNIPFGIKFGLNDGLIPTPSRENLVLDDTTIQKILDKTRKAVEEIVGLIKTPTDSIVHYYKYLDQNTRSLKVGEVEVSIDRKPLVTLMEYFEISERKYFQNDYFNVKVAHDIIGHMLPCCTYQRYGKLEPSSEYCHFSSSDVFLDIPFKNIHKQYFREKQTGYRYFFSERQGLKLWNFYYRYLKTYSVPREKWRECITWIQQECQKVKDTFPNRLSNYLPEIEKFQSTNKKGTRSSINRSAEELVLHLPQGDCDYVTSPKTFTLENLPKNLIIYGTRKSDLENLYPLSKRSDFILARVSNADAKILEKVKNAMTVEKFMKGDTKLAKKWVTAYIIYEDLKGNVGNLWEKCATYSYSTGNKKLDFRGSRLRNESLKKSMLNIEKYLEKRNAFNNDSLMKSLVETFKANNLLDEPILKEWEFVKSELLKLKPILRVVSHKDEEFITFLSYMKGRDYYKRMFTQLKDKCK